jgi:hypothetical protein
MAGSVVLPSRSAVVDDTEEKQFRTALSLPRYMKLTNEAVQRGGMTIYQLTRVVMSLYVDKKLVPFDELPPDIQQSIKNFYASAA